MIFTCVAMGFLAERQAQQPAHAGTTVNSARLNRVAGLLEMPDGQDSYFIEGMGAIQQQWEAEGRAPATKNIPVAGAFSGTEGALEGVAEIHGEAIVIQQRVVNVHQKYHLAVA